ncbi:chorismate mutase [Methanocaldococcus fervens]|uniref:Chorismate mutase n=1 Tax=Methanocaldococcus fervens (strain DSM 4213 / JCM 15782 / AG86) TaxID=573064 RepID=C7P6S7_METFA|nr:chorismate mutase [Methanocaldococcus fervens]ACV24259.1 chorismate mutase [Methanocaldococcus fervens AG86]
MKKKLAEIRKKIDDIDNNILKLIAERNSLAKDVAEIKNQLGIPIDDPDREKYIYDRIRKLCKEHNVDENVGIKIFQILIEHNKALQKKYLEETQNKNKIFKQ